MKQTTKLCFPPFDNGAQDSFNGYPSFLLLLLPFLAINSTILLEETTSEASQDHNASLGGHKVPFNSLINHSKNGRPSGSVPF